LLMRSGEVACVLDFEHFKTHPLLAGLGFAAYKLIRQTMVTVESPARAEQGARLAAQWIEAWQDNFPESNYQPYDLGIGARDRVLWLSDLILEGSAGADHRYDYDLEKQIGSLYEIEVIFGKSRA